MIRIVEGEQWEDAIVMAMRGGRTELEVGERVRSFSQMRSSLYSSLIANSILLLFLLDLRSYFWHFRILHILVLVLNTAIRHLPMKIGEATAIVIVVSCPCSAISQSDYDDPEPSANCKKLEKQWNRQRKQCTPAHLSNGCLFVNQIIHLILVLFVFLQPKSW